MELTGVTLAAASSVLPGNEERQPCLRIFFTLNCGIGAAFGLLVVVLLALDLLVFHRRIHTPTLWESTWWSVFWIALALVFNGFVWWWGIQTHGDSKAGIDFLTGYLVEKSLSTDNLFVFAVIFRFFRVELKYQYRVLFWGCWARSSCGFSSSWPVSN